MGKIVQIKDLGAGRLAEKTQEGIASGSKIEYIGVMMSRKPLFYSFPPPLSVNSLLFKLC